MAKKNDTTFFENKLLDFVTAKNPLLEMLQWVMDKFMEIEVAHKTGAPKGIHCQTRTSYRCGYRRIDASMEKRLKKLGFGMVRYKNHYIMNYYLCGKELRFEVDKTPGDFRSGIKTVKDISNVILRSGLVYSN